MAAAIVADGIFELVLGVVLIVAAAASPSDGLVMAGPASRSVIIAFGALLLPIGVGLLAVSSRLSVSLVRGLAIINGVSGIVIGAWLIATWAAFSPLGRGLAVLTVAGLILLALAELYISNMTSST